jgi:hypothetical protein
MEINIRAMLVAAASSFFLIHMGLIVGLGFVAAGFGINYQFAARPINALFIDGGYHTLQFVMFGVVLGLWH